MSEEANTPKGDAQAKTAKPKKGGRPKQIKASPVAVEPVTTGEAVKKAAPRPYGPWASGRAIKIRIHHNNEESEWVSLKLGDFPTVHVRRGVDVIVPWEMKGVLDDTVVDVPMIAWDGGKPVYEYNLKKTRFEYSYFGEVPWDEYVKFRTSENKKPMATTTIRQL